MLRFLFCLTFCLFTLGEAAAQLPVTQVYVFDYQQRDTTMTFTKPRYLTAFNQRGYNNHPAWLDRNTLLLSVQLPEMQQPDIFSFDVANRTRTRMTRTLSGEYSPKPIGDGRRFSAVRQEYVGRDTVLRLWEFPTSMADNGRPVFKYVNGVGYYEWLNSSQLALFLVGTPSTLALAAADSDAPRTLATNVGRSFKRLPNGNLTYVNKQQLPWQIVEQNLYRLTEQPRVVTSTIQGSEDFAILPDGSYLMAAGSRIYRFDPIRNPGWREVVDLRFYGITNISRMAVSTGGQIAVVTDR